MREDRRVRDLSAYDYWPDRRLPFQLELSAATPEMLARGSDRSRVQEDVCYARLWPRLWCIYGYFAGSIPVVIFSSLNLVLSITILVLTIRNSAAEAQGA